MTPHFSVDIDPFNLDETWLAVREDCTTNGALALVCDHCHFNIAVKHAGFILTCRRNFDATLFRDHRGGHHVYIGCDRFHDPGDNSTVERFKIHLGSGPIIENIDGFNRLVGQLANEISEMPRQRNPWAHNLGFFRRNAWHVECIFDSPCQQVV